MTVEMNSWETKLLSLAFEGAAQQKSHKNRSISRLLKNRLALQRAFTICEEITRTHSKTFYMASGFLPRKKRLFARVLYAFCRITDDLVDNQPNDSGYKIRDWEKSILSDVPDLSHPVSLAWHVVCQDCHIPPIYAQQLVDGVAKDLVKVRYKTFDELVAYCYAVASTVGLMSMHIIGYAGPEAVLYAIRLGVALQLTNILRDVGEDWQQGRLYLPLNELAQYNLTEADINRGVVDNRWRKFMQFQISRARNIYTDAIPGIRMLDRDGRFSIAAAAIFYRSILDEIEQNDYDVFHQRTYVSTWGKMRRLPEIWALSLYG